MVESKDRINFHLKLC